MPSTGCMFACAYVNVYDIYFIFCCVSLCVKVYECVFMRLFACINSCLNVHVSDWTYVEVRAVVCLHARRV